MPDLPDDSIERRLAGLRFAEPPPALRQQTLAAARATLADADRAPSWTLEAVLAATVLVLALALGHQSGSGSSTAEAPTSPDVLALVDAAGTLQVARHVPAVRPAHSNQPGATLATASEITP